MKFFKRKPKTDLDKYLKKVPKERRQIIKDIQLQVDTGDYKILKPIKNTN